MHILDFREVDRASFENIRTGRKRLETRAGVEKYRQIKAGDEITFVCGGDTFIKTVSKVYAWPTIEDMLEEIPLEKIMPDVKSVEEMRVAYASYPNYSEKLERFGLVGFEFT